jgi:ComF family protein
MVVRTSYMSTNPLVIVYKWLLSGQFNLLPGVCVVCRAATQRQLDLCRDCQRSFKRHLLPCPGCAMPLPPGAAPNTRCGSCLLHDRGIYRTEAAFAWAEPVSGLISGFKYQGHLQHGRVLGSLLAEQLAGCYQPHELPELLVPVPLHPARLRERGFNQSLLLARQLGAALAIPVASDLVARVARTPPQQGLSAQERRRNLRRAFHVSQTLQLQQFHSIALVDDVVTTMSTTRELARVLRRHGRDDLAIHVWALARA